MNYTATLDGPAPFRWRLTSEEQIDGLPALMVSGAPDGTLNEAEHLFTAAKKLRLREPEWQGRPIWVVVALGHYIIIVDPEMIRAAITFREKIACASSSASPAPPPES